jgi:hypothetical protein
LVFINSYQAQSSQEGCTAGSFGGLIAGKSVSTLTVSVDIDKNRS